VIAYGCLIRRGACREHLDYIYRGLISHHQHAKLYCNTPPRCSQRSKLGRKTRVNKGTPLKVQCVICLDASRVLGNRRSLTPPTINRQDRSWLNQLTLDVSGSALNPKSLALP